MNWWTDELLNGKICEEWTGKLMSFVFCREAARTRYLSQEADCQYFHNIMSEYFLGTFGNGKPKPFKFTEIQRHRFGLKSKDAAEDRQVDFTSLNFKIELLYLFKGARYAPCVSLFWEKCQKIQPEEVGRADLPPC